MSERLTKLQLAWLESADDNGIITPPGSSINGRMRRTLEALLDRDLIRWIPTAANVPQRYRLSPYAQDLIRRRRHAKEPTP